MNFYINPACLTSAFTVPAAVVDNHLKFTKAEHIKVLLFVMRNMMSDVSEQAIAEATDLSEYDVWLAHYTTKTNYQGEYKVWQMCSNGRVDGIYGDVDINIMYN